MTSPLLKTKFHIPPVRRRWVPRPRLLQQLDLGLHRKVVIISAPAGFGKTTLLSEWIATSGPGASVAWLSLDKGDNDPTRFWVHLVAALQSTCSAVSESGRTALESPQLPITESHLTRVINWLTDTETSICLILDDYHLIETPTIHDALRLLIEHLPENVHLYIATRADPSLPLPRLRARGHLIELRQSDLRFTVEEAAAFLKDVMGLDLTAEEVATLEARTEGWIAGLQMAALSLQGRSLRPATRSAFLRSFTGSHRFVLDYLVEEVLEQQPPALQDFLLKTSILERLNGTLCDSVLGTKETVSLTARDTEGEGWHLPANVPSSPATGSQAILEYLEAANLFILPLDDARRWYRYHRLFADLLRKRLGQTFPDLVPALHRRASAWHEKQGLMAAAIDHALAARDLGRAVMLVEENVQATLMRSEVTTFLNWMAELPDELVRARPTLCFFHAWALLMSGRSLDAVEHRLGDVTCLQDVPESAGQTAGRMAALGAYLSLFQVDMQRAAALCREALEHLPANDLFLRNIVDWILSLTRLAQGDFQDGRQALIDVARRGEEIGNPLIAVTALCHQAKLQARQGRLQRAQDILVRALQVATDPRGRRLPIASEALIGLGELDREWNDLEAAADHLAEGIELAKQWSELAAFDAYPPLARVRLAQGNAKAAQEALDAAQRIALRSKITNVDDLVIDLQQAYLAAQQGDIDGAMRWAEKRGLLPAQFPDLPSNPELDRDFVTARLRKYEYLVLARVFILQDRATQALDLLEPLLAHARDQNRTDLAIEIQILRALACHGDGQNEQARSALAEALCLAEPGGYVRVFLDEGASMARLLRQAGSQGIAPAYVAKLLAAFAREESAEADAESSYPHTQPLIEPLSERELQVLRLLATGLSNPEVADELYIAVSTVRSHCKSIYGKLNVHRRWDAIQRAQELGLI